MATPLYLDYFRRSEAFGAPRAISVTLEYGRRGEPLSAIAGLTAIVSTSALVATGVLAGVTTSGSAVHAAAVIAAAGSISTATNTGHAVTVTSALVGSGSISTATAIIPLFFFCDPRSATLVSTTSNPFAVDPRAAILVS